MLPLLCVFTALATRCYYNTNTVMVKWSQPDRGPGISAWKGLSAPLVPLASVTPTPELLWSCHGEPRVKWQAQGWHRSIGCCDEAKTTSSRNQAPACKRRVWRMDSMVCMHLRVKRGRGLCRGMMLLVTNCQWKTYYWRQDVKYCSIPFRWFICRSGS